MAPCTASRIRLGDPNRRGPASSREANWTNEKVAAQEVPIGEGRAPGKELDASREGHHVLGDSGAPDFDLRQIRCGARRGSERPHGDPDPDPDASRQALGGKTRSTWRPGRSTRSPRRTR